MSHPSRVSATAPNDQAPGHKRPEQLKDPPNRMKKYNQRKKINIKKNPQLYNTSSSRIWTLFITPISHDYNCYPTSFSYLSLSISISLSLSLSLTHTHTHTYIYIYIYDTWEIMELAHFGVHLFCFVCFFVVFFFHLAVIKR